jgi:hypothetical protein
MLTLPILVMCFYQTFACQLSFITMVYASLQSPHYLHLGMITVIVLLIIRHGYEFSWCASSFTLVDSLTVDIT